jgi:hypothetical protein
VVLYIDSDQVIKGSLVVPYINMAEYSRDSVWYLEVI